MTLEFRRFVPADLSAIEVQPAQAWMTPSFDPWYADELATAGPCFTFARPDGDASSATASLHERDVVFIGGAVPFMEGAALAWSLISEAAGPHMLEITRRSRAFFGRLPVERIECAVETGHAEGHRWARMLGFRRDLDFVTMWLGDRPHALYARYGAGILQNNGKQSWA
ncbi:MAG: hypothetical protein H6851_05150 [Geminicoccaceae bacterium]|nr:hypothetical protein [Geminicoccaceae bacterium]